MSMSEEHVMSLPRREKSLFHRSSHILFAVVLVAGIVMSSSATADDKSKVLTFGKATAKELKFSEDPVTLVFAVDKSGRVQEFQADGTKRISVPNLGKNPLKADAILSFQTFSIIKTQNPKICWPNAFGGADCVSW